MSTMTMTRPPPVCTETLSSLEESLLGERTLCLQFVYRYIDMWPHRFERIYDAVMASHSDDAMDAALSLRSASMMVGAARLGELSTELILLIESERFDDAAMELDALRRCGNQTTCHLTDSYINVA